MGPGDAKLGPNSSVRSEIGKNNFISKAECSPSVKGKKVIARNRAATTSNKDASGSSKPPFSCTSQIPKILSRKNIRFDLSTPFLFSTTTSAEMSNQPQRKGRGNANSSDSRNRGKVDAWVGEVRSTVDESLKFVRPFDERKCEGGLSTSTGLDLGMDAEHKVDASDRRPKMGGGKENGMEGDTITPECSDTMHGRPNGITIEKEDAKEADHHGDGESPPFHDEDMDYKEEGEAHAFP